MSRFTITDTPLPGLRLVQRQRIEDARGFFSRFFCAGELADSGFDRPIAQINQTRTNRKGSVRGMHFQHAPYAEIKWVSCLRGEVFDVAVDLRRGSPTFGRWHGESLSERNMRSLLIPTGFAHGFQTLSEDVELLYLHSAPYVAAAEGGVNPRDPSLAIDWPLPFADLSDRDAGHPYIAADFEGLAA